MAGFIVNFFNKSIIVTDIDILSHYLTFVNTFLKIIIFFYLFFYFCFFSIIRSLCVYFICLGTVYRNLKLLADQGKIKRLCYGDSKERFDGNISQHNHFICKQCDNVIDLDMESFEHINTLAQVCFSIVFDD